MLTTSLRFASTIAFFTLLNLKAFFLITAKSFFISSIFFPNLDSIFFFLFSKLFILPFILRLLILWISLSILSISDIAILMLLDISSIIDMQKLNSRQSSIILDPFLAALILRASPVIFLNTRSSVLTLGSSFMTSSILMLLERILLASAMASSFTKGELRTALL